MADGLAADFNGIEDEDEALRRAIQMSLGHDGPATHETVDLTQEDVSTASEASADEAEILPSSSKQNIQPISATPPSTQTSTTSFGAIGLDRKRMEEERLARLQKRKAADLDTVTSDSRPQQRLRIDHPSPAALLRHVDLPKGSIPKTSSSSRSLPYLKGAVKKTWAKGYPRVGDDITIEEVLQKDELQLAVISSYIWDEDFILSKIDVKRTKVLLIAFADNEAQQADMEANVPSRNVRFCFPHMNGPGSMHSKLQLLKFEHHLRVVVPTANFVSFDWGETGVMENMVFLIDLPLIEDPKARAANKLTAFGEELCYFLTQQGIDDSLVQSLSKYDFSETVRYGFVHTIAGSHVAKEAWTRTGYCGLGRAVKGLSLHLDTPSIDFVTSSLGALTYDFLNMIVKACQGDSGITEYEARTSKPKRAKAASIGNSDTKNSSKNFRVYFPSHDTVTQSRGGQHNAGTICFQERWWDSSSFPREVLRDCKSTRKGLLMHNKVMFARPGPEEASAAAGFAYVGSANLSESAWGRLVKDQVTKMPKLTCRNWECGVLVPAASVKLSDGAASASLPSGSQQSSTLAAFDGSCPVPMEVPGALYDDEGGTMKRRPWFFRG